MSFPTKVRFLFLGVFLLGALAGGWGIHYYDESTQQFTQFLDKASDPTSSAIRVLQKYQKRYQLTPEETARITPLVQEMTRSVYQQRNQFGTDVLHQLDVSHEQIAAQLTPEHRDAYLKRWSIRRPSIAATLFGGTNAAPSHP